jgi:hypothetical protein
MIRREQTYQEREHYKERVSLVVVVTKKETSKETSKEGERKRKKLREFVTRKLNLADVAKLKLPFVAEWLNLRWNPNLTGMAHTPSFLIYTQIK